MVSTSSKLTTLEQSRRKRDRDAEFASGGTENDPDSFVANEINEAVWLCGGD
jgi:hypothetical protein